MQGQFTFTYFKLIIIHRSPVNYYKCFNSLVIQIIIHQTHYEKSDWSRAFNQFTIACELHMINAISATDTVLHLSCQVQHLPGY